MVAQGCGRGAGGGADLAAAGTGHHAGHHIKGCAAGRCASSPLCPHMSDNHTTLLTIPPDSESVSFLPFLRKCMKTKGKTPFLRKENPLGFLFLVLSVYQFVMPSTVTMTGKLETYAVLFKVCDITQLMSPALLPARLLLSVAPVDTLVCEMGHGQMAPPLHLVVCRGMAPTGGIALITSGRLELCTLLGASRRRRRVTRRVRHGRSLPRSQVNDPATLPSGRVALDPRATADAGGLGPQGAPGRMVLRVGKYGVAPAQLAPTAHYLLE